MTDWYLRITKKRFKELYGDRIDLKLFTQDAENDEELVSKYLTSKIWRLNNLYTVVDKDANRVRFVMNSSQHKVYAASLQHPRLVILKSRQQGISTFWLVSFLDDALFGEDLSVGLMSQGLSESAVLLKRVKLAWRELPDAIRQFLELAISRDNSSEISLSNGSTIYINTSFRSATLQRLHISEYGKISAKHPERAIETKTGTLQAIRPGNTVAIESTAEGDNLFKQMWDQAIEAEVRASRVGGVYAGKDFKPVFLSWLDDPDCVSDTPELLTPKQEEYFDALEEVRGGVIEVEQKNFWVAQWRELDERIYQEYPATPEEAFTKVNEGSYYAQSYLQHVVKRGREVAGLYDSNLEVNVSMDLGIDEEDLFTLVFFQVWEGETRVIDEYTSHGEGLEHYVNVIRDTGYDINWVVCPHDIKVRELGTGISRFRRLQELGVKKIKVLPRTSIADGIEAVRRVLPDLWIDPQRCGYLVKCFRNYSKEWDEKRSTWKSKALHDRWSHGADALRYMVMSKVGEQKKRVGRGRSVGRDRSVVDGLAL